VRLVVAIACSLLLSGCLLWRDSNSAEVTSHAGKVDQYADKNDLIMSRAAASVLVASEANSKGLTTVVTNELSIAQSYLPRPTASDEAYARSRALKSDPKAYEKAKAVADTHQRQLDYLWGKVEAEKQKAKDQLEAKEQELVAAEKSRRNIIIIGVGSIIILSGVAMIMTGASKKNAGIGIGIGTAVVALPQYMDSQAFLWVASGLSIIITSLILIFNWHRLKKPNCNNETQA
jgi:hypothetical protein